MRQDGFVGDPIDAVEHNGELFIIDGHHRRAAAKSSGTKVNVNIVDDISSHPSSYENIEQVLKDADSVGLDNLKRRRK